MTGLGKILIGAGLAMALVGVLLVVAGRIGLPLGRLPGDFAWRGKNFSIFFPLGTSILLSVLVSAVLYIISHLHR